MIVVIRLNLHTVLVNSSNHSRARRHNRDLKHHDGRHDDGIPEVYFPFRSCAEPEKLIAIRRRTLVGDATSTVLA